MGYDVYITRKSNWFDERGSDIDIEEWKGLVQADPDMRLDGNASVALKDGSTLRVESDGLAVWSAYSGNGNGGNMAWLDFQQGNVVVKNPDGEILGKMWQLAQRLNAKVQGDDCELYDADGHVIG
ncbi:hypothetical protein [Cupriavidus sp. UME77]|uniref:hypothetical protein n=1 Tax=Cupriavidus sp. UME77 TaxID=1862321 RepID=UPI0015FF63B2|nr:hypothetical protein [Cupriavidus sp. UME77]MBB1631037.1 hypothetical protein [Cupriavidus sp. UME77]